MSEKIKIDDPLLDFFHGLLESHEEKEIVSMILEGFGEEQIIEKIIDYKEEKDKEVSND